MFKLIPVIDLLDGQVVHAQRGLREHYRPIETPLAASAEPLAVVAALLSLHAFEDLYIADLGAILGKGGHREVVDRLVAAFPWVRWWVDAAITNGAELRAWSRTGVLPVVGSESVTDIALISDCNGPFALSLDQKDHDLLDPAGLHARPDLWPQDVIAMTLDRVGSDAGPALDVIASIRHRHPSGRIYAAGGVRHLADLLELQAAGVAGALVASALHTGAIGPAEIRAITQSTGSPSATGSPSDTRSSTES